ncbi:MAG TPA: TlpA disulfide reductase family protein [Paucimonas sp.]|nr:TlpA disulfide reductase family protein [Paucimonas sp.]
MSGLFRRFLRHAALAVAAVLSAAAAAVDPGSSAPGFELPGQAAPIRLADHGGKLVYLDFWASWCGPCKRSFPWMNELQSRFGARGLQVIAVNLDAKREDADRFLAATNARFPIAFDPAGATARAYAIKGMPSSVLIAPDGRVILKHAGFNDGDKAELERQIELALKPSK